MAHHYYPPRRLVTISQRPTSSFIFLHDSNSSATHLSAQLTHALKPRSIKDIFGPRTNILFLNAPIKTFLPTPPPTPSSQTQEEPQQQQYTWLSTLHHKGADDVSSTATTSWSELSICMNQLDEAVMEESKRVGGRENVFLVGVGMGFAVAATYVLQMEERVGGLLGMGGWLPFHERLKRVGVYGEVVGLDNLSERHFEMKRRDEGDEDDVDEEEEEEDVFGSGYSTPTLCEEHTEQADTSELMLKRIKGFLEYVLLRGKPPMHPRVCNRIDSSTPVVLVHGAEDEEVSFTYAKEAQETLRHLGFDVTLRVVEGETHKLSRELIGDLMDVFMVRGLGNEDVRGAVGEMLLGGWL
ncbi:hypothetical protein TgHK011_000675 [Trichoderma gracile]|nr:hypothetical protein TgHK011_000675 [Trichoderma gracile]